MDADVFRGGAGAVTRRVVTCCPVIVPPRANIVESWTHPDHVVIVNGDHDAWRERCAGRPWHMIDDHGPTNLGCPASWNRAFGYAQRIGAEYVVIMSQSLLVHDGTAALAAEVAEHANAYGLVNAATPEATFHCIAISVALWAELDGFDESFPIWCDIDFLRRVERGHGGGQRCEALFAPGYVAATTERCIALRAGAVTRAVYDDDKAHYLEVWGTLR